MPITSPNPKNLFQVRNINFRQTINSNRFTLRINGLDTLLKMASSASGQFSYIRNRYEAMKDVLSKEVDPNFSYSQLLELALTSVQLPNPEIETTPIAKFNDSVKVPTKFAEMGDMTVEFYDYVNGSASAILELWKAFVGDKVTGAIGFKEVYVKDADFYVYGPDAPGYIPEKDYTEIPWLQKHKIINIYPKTIDYGTHASDSAEPRKISVTFSVDNIFLDAARGFIYKQSGELNNAGLYYTAEPVPVSQSVDGLVNG